LDYIKLPRALLGWPPLLFVQVSQEEWDAVVSAQTEVNPFLKWSFLNALEVSGSAVSTCAACEVCHSSCIAVEQLTGSVSYTSGDSLKPWQTVSLRRVCGTWCNASLLPSATVTFLRCC
jgi:hypothetical protein